MIRSLLFVDFSHLCSASSSKDAAVTTSMDDENQNALKAFLMLTSREISRILPKKYLRKMSRSLG